jgi:hypothetical protein
MGDSETNNLLQQLVHEVSSLRQELNSITGKIEIYDLDDIHSAIRALESKFDDLADQLTGAGASEGSTLDDVCAAIQSLQSTIDQKD